MLVINKGDIVSKKTGEYFVNNGLHKSDPKHNPEKYMIRIGKLRLDCVLALYEQKKIIVTDTKDYDKHIDLGFICFWYDDFDDINQKTIFLDIAYVDEEENAYIDSRSAIFRNHDKIYDALVANKIIFKV